MEVHHHTHSTGSQQRHSNKWTHYFWEFLMLFLAVFCGFLAEYQLEHKIEKDRAKEFASLMFQDLKKDTSFFNQGSVQFKMIKKHQDSMLLLLQEKFEDINHFALVRHWINSVWALNPISHQSTYEQMKSSGSLRFIRHKELIKSIQEYYTGILPDIIHYHLIQSELTENRIVPYIEDHINYQEADFLSSAMNVPQPEIFDWNKRTAIKLYNMIALLTYQNQFLNDLYLKATNKANETMQILKQQYHLK